MVAVEFSFDPGLEPMIMFLRVQRTLRLCPCSVVLEKPNTIALFIFI